MSNFKNNKMNLTTVRVDIFEIDLCNVILFSMWYGIYFLTPIHIFYNLKTKSTCHKIKQTNSDFVKLNLTIL